MVRSENLIVVLVLMGLQTTAASNVTSYLSKYDLTPPEEETNRQGIDSEMNDTPCPISCHNGGTCAVGAADFSMFPAADKSGTPFTFLKQTSRLGYYCSCPPGFTGLRCSVPYVMEQNSEKMTVHVCFHGGTFIEGLSVIHSADQQFCDCTNAIFKGRTYVGKNCESTGLAEAPSVDGETCNLECGPGECTIAKLQTNIDHQHSLTARNLTHSYCQCPGQYSGNRCEIDLSLTTITIQDIDDHLPRDDPECHLDCGLGHCARGLPTQEEDAAANSTQVYYDYEKSHADSFMFCICPQNSTGQYCEVTDHDAGTATASSDGDYFCLNGGVLEVDVEGQNCHCRQGFEGEHCEYKHGQVPTCDVDCGEHGKCILGSNKYLSNVTQNHPELVNELQFFSTDAFQHCKCEPGWIGGLCDIKVEVCGEDEHLCLNGSKCLEQADGSYQCDCEEAFTSESRFAGNYCQHHHTQVCHSLEQSPFSGTAQNLFCVNDGICSNLDSE